MEAIVTLNKPQMKLATGVLARAFHDDPLWAYFFPNASERPNKLFHVLRMFVQHGILYGKVYATSSNLEGVSVWLPSDKADMSPWRMMRWRVFGDAQDEWGYIMDFEWLRRARSLAPTLAIGLCCDNNLRKGC